MHISDIHYSGLKDSSRLEKLYNIIKNYKTNYICITGDLIDSNNVVESDINSKYLIEWIKKLSKLSVILISLGNHDIFLRNKHKLVKYYNKNFWNRIRSINNVYVLDNEAYSDKNIYVYGFTLSYEYYYKYKKESVKLLLDEINKNRVNEINENKLKICMMHSPLRLSEKSVKEKFNCYDLILTGHMHNGVVPPIIDEIFDNDIGIISPGKKLFPKMARGIIIDNNILSISAGMIKFHVTVTPLIRWANIIYPIPINIINVTNKKCDTKKSHRYVKQNY